MLCFFEVAVKVNTCIGNGLAQRTETLQSIVYQLIYGGISSNFIKCVRGHRANQFYYYRYSYQRYNMYLRRL